MVLGATSLQCDATSHSLRCVKGSYCNTRILSVGIRDTPSAFSPTGGGNLHVRTLYFTLVERERERVPR